MWFYSVGVQTQDCAHTKQAFYFWTTTPSTPLCSRTAWNRQSSCLQLSGAGARDGRHHAKCWLILQSAQHWDLLSRYERIKMWFSFYANMNFDRGAHNLFPSWSLFQIIGLPSKTRVLYSNCSAGLLVARNHKWIREAMAVSINCPNSKATRRNKITVLFVMAVYFQ